MRFSPPTQPNMDTRQKQMEGWCSLILSYCRHHKIFVLDLPASLSNSLPLFHNKGAMILSERSQRPSSAQVVHIIGKKSLFSPFEGIERRLSSEALRAVFDYLHGQGQCEWLDGKEKNSSLIFWKTPTEWGNLIYNWAVSTGNTDTVCTVFELIEGDDTSGESSTRHWAVLDGTGRDRLHCWLW